MKAEHKEDLKLVLVCLGIGVACIALAFACILAVDQWMLCR